MVHGVHYAAFMASKTKSHSRTHVQRRAAGTPGEMPMRELGKTGERVSMLGLGGSHIGTPELTAPEAVRIIRAALDGGMNFMDNSWDYHNGASERRLGKALKDGYRQKAFVMTKVDGRNAKEATRQIEQSLRRLGTDHVDLLQHHEVIRFDDADRIFAPGGAMEAFIAARQAGKIRYIGFTGHKDPHIHLYMLEKAREAGFRFDTVQMPLNVLDAHFRSFESHVLPALVQEGIGVLGMKSMGSGVLLRSKVVTPIECLHYALSLPTSVVITGIDSREILDQAFEAARTFRALSSDEVKALLARTAEAARGGEYELFKTTTYFDSTIQNPDWLGDDPERVKTLTA
ncbi:MAG TPA: aldo/keto reductase [Bryobacteraceae bacterium]|nr:aldo/keto reductase [Bryobacteraceae bacterium]